MHPDSQREAERNSPERSECTSGLAAPRTTLWQGATNAEAPRQGKGIASSTTAKRSDCGPRGRRRDPWAKGATWTP